MHIYIDESGAFVPLGGAKSRISAVAALIIPSAGHAGLLRRFGQLRKRLMPNGGEIKGSKLKESAIAEIASLLGKFDVMGEAVIVDSGLLMKEDVEAFQEQQARRIVAGLPTDGDEDFRHEMQTLSALSVDVSAQNFLQAFLMVALIDKVIRMATLYHSQRDGRELASFHWIIDAKDKSITGVERLWTEIVSPAMHSRSIQDPVAFMPWGDYSHFVRFEEEIEGRPRINNEMVLADRRFADSKSELGLQLVDVFVSGLTRAFNKSLNAEGWLDLGTLLVHRNIDSDIAPAVQMLTLRTSSDQPARVRKVNFHGWVFEQLAGQAKPMVPRWHQKRMKPGLA